MVEQSLRARVVVAVPLLDRPAISLLPVPVPPLSHATMDSLEELPSIAQVRSANVEITPKRDIYS